MAWALDFLEDLLLSRPPCHESVACRKLKRNRELNNHRYHFEAYLRSMILWLR